jgi:uncharacterized protein YfeS
VPLQQKIKDFALESTNRKKYYNNLIKSVVDHSSSNKIQEIHDNTFSTNRDS